MTRKKPRTPLQNDDDDDGDDDGSETSEEEKVNGDRDSLLGRRHQLKQRSRKRDPESGVGEGRVTNAALAARLHITNSIT